LPESSQPVERPFGRPYLAQHLNLPPRELEGPNAQQLPLLYSLTALAAQRHLLQPVAAAAPPPPPAQAPAQAATPPPQAHTPQKPLQNHQQQPQQQPRRQSGPGARAAA
jgi:hypothetical protein